MSIYRNKRTDEFASNETCISIALSHYSNIFQGHISQNKKTDELASNDKTDEPGKLTNLAAPPFKG